MDFDPVEGVHYIFDRYAFLNGIMADGGYTARIDAATPKADLLKVIGSARGMYHPDRQARSGEEMRKKAEQKTMLIADCERFLLNPELKNFYDDRLAEFKASRPHLVSDNGAAIISLGETFFDISALLSDKIVDTSAFETQVKQMLQYDETRVTQARTLYDMLPDNLQVQAVYRDALTQKLVYLTLLEDAAWAKVGYMNRKEKPEGFMLRPSDYAGRIEAELQKAATRDIDTTVEKHGAVARLGMAKTPLLLEAAPQENIAEEEGAEHIRRDALSAELADPKRYDRLMESFKAAAHKNFGIRADYVRDVARQKQAVLETLCLLSPVEALGTELPGQEVYDFYLLNPKEGDEQKVLLRLAINALTGTAEVHESYAGAELTLSQLKSRGFERQGFAVTRNAEIADVMVELGAAADRFLERKEKEREALKNSPPVPASDSRRPPRPPRNPGLS